MKIEIFDPAMCCSSGVCGPSVDPELVRVQETLRKIQKEAGETVTVVRYGLGSDPKAFVANTIISEILKAEGPEALPVVITDGKVISKKGYPSNEEFQGLLKGQGVEINLTVEKKSCGCGPRCC